MTGKTLMLLLGAYLLGSIPAAYLVTRFTTGEDIRYLGNGNVGAKNTYETVGKQAGFAVAVANAVDELKKHAHYVTTRCGGSVATRAAGEAAEEKACGVGRGSNRAEDDAEYRCTGRQSGSSPLSQ